MTATSNTAEPAKKICVAGAFGVGKSSLVRRLVLNEFNPTYLATLGVTIESAVLELPEGPFNATVWDLEGEEKPSPSTLNYFIGASAAVIAADCTRTESYVAMNLTAQAFSETAPGKPMLLLANKCDLAPANHTALEEMSDLFDAPFIPASAKTGENVEEGFAQLCARIRALGA